VTQIRSSLLNSSNRNSTQSRLDRASPLLPRSAGAGRGDGWIWRWGGVRTGRQGGRMRSRDRAGSYKSA
jgi:hypothetical protein